MNSPKVNPENSSDDLRDTSRAGREEEVIKNPSKKTGEKSFEEGVGNNNNTEEGTHPPNTGERK